MICHGENGTIYQILLCGISVLSIPGNFENEWNADRIEELDSKELKRLIEAWFVKKNNAQFKKIAGYLTKPINIIEQ